MYITVNGRFVAVAAFLALLVGALGFGIGAAQKAEHVSPFENTQAMTYVLGSPGDYDPSTYGNSVKAEWITTSTLKETCYKVVVVDRPSPVISVEGSEICGWKSDSAPVVQVVAVSPFTSQPDGSRVRSVKLNGLVFTETSHRDKDGLHVAISNPTFG